MLKPERGDVWLVRFPFTNLSAVKLRPALVWALHGEDAIVIGIFSRIPADELRATWLLVTEAHAQFAKTGLKKASIIKAEKIAVIHEGIFHRKLGDIPADLMQCVERALRLALLLP
jgi:mRNA interferase MazF